MSFLSIFLFAVSANIDNFVIGISYGIKHIKVTWQANILIAVLTFSGTLLSMLAAQGLTQFISLTLSNTIGSLILIVIGIISIIQYIICEIKKGGRACSKKNIELAETYDKNSNKKLEWHEAFVLGLSLSINNIGVGIGASIAGIGIIPAAISTLICSMLFLYTGNKLGNSCFSKLLGRHTQLVSGLIIIALGMWEIISLSGV